MWRASVRTARMIAVADRGLASDKALTSQAAVFASTEPGGSEVESTKFLMVVTRYPCQSSSTFPKPSNERKISISSREGPALASGNCSDVLWKGALSTAGAAAARTCRGMNGH